MTDLLQPASASPGRFAIPVGAAPALFAGAVFASASLVFLVQPMVARLVLPTLGGSPAVWNTSMAFFQAALLVGYAYAHLLQRLRDPRLQGMIHVAALTLAGLVLPLRVTEMFGAPPTVDNPAFWLVGVLAVSIGLPFAVLSATAPLLQAWYARVRAGRPDAANPYVLYAASNLGSLIALLAYPLIVEPLLLLREQTVSWSALYGVFVFIMAAVAWAAANSSGSRASPAPAKANAGTWRERLIWLALAAAPSSLMLGVTNYAATDVASAPFLWVLPLALYLITFIIAFQAKPAISPDNALLLHGAAAPAAALTLALPILFFVGQIGLHFACFFLTALVCHQTLAARRPPAERLTEFYLMVSAGGVVGGAFNAFVAPMIFTSVLEYPLVLALACLARPEGKRGKRDFPLLICGLGAILFALAATMAMGMGLGAKLLFACGMVSAFLLRARPLYFFVLIGALVIAGAVGQREDVLKSERSFFGVMRTLRIEAPGLGEVRVMAHGATVHGAQAADPAWKCHPMTYYAPATPIGQTFAAMGARSKTLNIGAVGMGAGTVAAYVRPADRMRFFEIDPHVVRMATDPAQFSFIGSCARGAVTTVIGDGRLSLEREAPGAFDLLLVDAFSSDSVPAHMLTVEAMQLYLSRIADDGIVAMHVSNRNLELMGPVASAAQAAGGVAIAQRYRPAETAPMQEGTGTDVILIARTDAALAPFRDDRRWKPAQASARHWTDDYMNLVGALIRKLGEPA